jgi:integrase
MEFVQPIKSKEHIAAMKSYLRQRSLRDALLFTLGISSALRISDLLRLTVEDVDGKDRVSIKEAKSARVAKGDKAAKEGKTKDFVLSPICVSAINEYLDTRSVRSGFLFPSRKGDAQITRQHAYKVINDAAKYVGVITEKNGVHIGAHSLRKTLGFHAYNNGTSIEVIQKIMNHSSSAITLRYIGIEQEDMDDVYVSLDSWLTV